MKKQNAIISNWKIGRDYEIEVLEALKTQGVWKPSMKKIMKIVGIKYNKTIRRIFLRLKRKGMIDKSLRPTGEVLKLDSSGTKYVGRTNEK